MSDEDKYPTLSRVEGLAERQPITSAEIDDFIRSLKLDTETRQQQIIDFLTRVKDSLPKPAQNFPEEERLGDRPAPIEQSPSIDIIEQAKAPAVDLIDPIETPPATDWNTPGSDKTIGLSLGGEDSMH